MIDSGFYSIKVVFDKDRNPLVLRNSFLWFFLLALILSSPTLAAIPTDDPSWELIVPGIEFRQFQLPDPNNVFVVRMDRNNPEVTLESSRSEEHTSELH